MDEALRQKIEERAYYLWQKEGCPEGRHEEFWERARLAEQAERDEATAPHVRSHAAEDAEVDEASRESFPASDPPAFTGARA